jgi:bla regulator protein BlaR1
MTTYIIKSILCSGILLMFYHLFLQKEKMHQFNRFYLLASIVFSLAIPLVSIELTVQTPPAYIPIAELDNLTESQEATQPSAEIPIQANTENYDGQQIMIRLYSAVSLVLLIRFIKNLLLIFRKKSGKPIKDYQHAKLVLLPEDVVTYTFLNYIFVNEKAFRNREIETEILTHELAHVRQKHTLDILFVELLHIIFWINPVLLFYKKAIRLNHEFLADGAVLDQCCNVKSYQLLLLDKILYTRQVTLTSSFNYSITKNRLEMMKTTRSMNRQMIKQFSIGILLVGAGFLFCEKTYSQDKPVSKEIKQGNAKPSKPLAVDKSRFTGSGLSPEELSNFNKTIKANSTSAKTPKGAAYLKLNLGIEEEKRMYALYSKMSKEQQAACEVTFFQMPIPVKSYPTVQMFESWKDPNTFGVWIDGKKVSNKALDKYRASDIAEFWSSKLYGAAKKGRIYKYQLDLTTNAEFDRTYQTRMNDRIAVGSKLIGMDYNRQE